MAFLDTVKARMGKDSYFRLQKDADREVGLAMEMPLKDGDNHEQFYTQRPLRAELLPECEAFERAGLKILPTDLINILFRCKLLFATQTEHEYRQRGGGVSFVNNFAVVPQWTNRAEKLETLTDRYIAALEGQLQERTLLSYISSFTSARPAESPQTSFDDLFQALGFPFVCFFDDEHLLEKHRQFEPGLPSYDQIRAKRFFSAPSIGFRICGSHDYCLWYSTMWLRTFLNMLRIASYLDPRQRMGVSEDVKMTAPTYPVFLGEHAQGCYSWEENKKESWAKIPDGCLFLSFGYRGLSEMWLDFRTLPAIRKFMLDHKEIFEYLKNPWNARSLNDISPALDILSSAAQIPDLGAKILLIYCCLEHLFVPKYVSSENKKYIIGGMNALAPHLLPWFRSLYNLRCAYAHKGFVLRNEETTATIAESMKNVMTLLVAKLSVS